MNHFCKVLVEENDVLHVGVFITRQVATLLSKQQCVALRPRTHFVRTYALYAMAINAGNEEETNRIPRCWLGPAGTNDNINIYLSEKETLGALSR